LSVRENPLFLALCQGKPDRQKDTDSVRVESA
jgi:hypothetical protein